MSFQDLESGAGRRFENGAGVSGIGRRGSAAAGASQRVASGIFQINTSVASFQKLVNSLGTPKDTPQLRDKLHQTRAQILQLIKGTTEKLKEASEADKNAEINASKRIADAKLAKDFKAIMQEFQKVQSLASQKEMTYAPFVPQTVLPSSYTASEVQVRSDKTPEQRAAVVEPRRQEVLLLDNEITFNEAIIDEREQGIKEIQHQIGEVNEIFKDLAVLVHGQGTMIEDINTNIENSVVSTSQAKTNLAKASKTQRSNSSLICLLMVIFGVVLLIVIIVLAA